MAEFRELIITEKGEKLLANITAGNDSIKFVYAIASDRVYQDVNKLTSISGEVSRCNIENIAVTKDNNIKMLLTFDNNGNNSGFYINTIGIYAKSRESGVILFAITTAIKPPYIPPFNGVLSSFIANVHIIHKRLKGDRITISKITEELAEINRLEKEVDDLRASIGILYGEQYEDVVGIEVDYKNNKFIRLANGVGKTPGKDFDSLLPFGGRKRCIVTNDGEVVAYYGEDGYTEEGFLLQEVQKNGKTYPINTEVQVMVEQPKFYYKIVPIKVKDIENGRGHHLVKVRYYISSKARSGFKVHPLFKDLNSYEQDVVYLAAFECSLFDTDTNTYTKHENINGETRTQVLNRCKLASVKGLIPQDDFSLLEFRKLAKNRGPLFESYGITALSASQLLFLVEYATFNIKKALDGAIINENRMHETGETTSLGNVSGNIDKAISYRGEENLFGNTETLIDGIFITNPSGVKQGTTGTITVMTGSPNWREIDPYLGQRFFSSVATGRGYISAFGYSSYGDWLFIPTAVAGSSVAPVGDIGNIITTHSGEKIPTHGGAYGAKSEKGLFTLNFSPYEGWRSSGCSSRLVLKRRV